MNPSAPFLVRRVLLGVVVGLAVLAVGFFGWTRYRTGQYHHREAATVARYEQAYRACLAGGSTAAGCSARAYAACIRDPFWLTQAPFAIDLGAGLDDAGTRCLIGTAGTP